MTATGRKKLDELYHPVTERSEFYSMVELHKPPVLFSPPAEHAIDKVIITTFLCYSSSNVVYLYIYCILTKIDVRTCLITILNLIIP